MRNQRPVVALPGSAPLAEQVARRVELEHLRRGEAARALWRLELRSLFVVLQRTHAPVRHPDVVLRIDRDAVDGPEDPHLRQRFGPQPIHFEPRHLPARPRLRGDGFMPAPIQPENADRGQKCRPNTKSAPPRPHKSAPPEPPVIRPLAMRKCTPHCLPARGSQLFLGRWDDPRLFCECVLVCQPRGGFCRQKVIVS